MTVMARPVNRKEVENNISCVDLSVANVLCWPLFMVTGRRGGGGGGGEREKKLEGI